MSITCLSDPDETVPSETNIVDVVFVHGLAQTGSQALIDHETGILWMRDLFPHAKYRVRMLLYEYDAESLMKPGGLADTSIYAEAVSLVNHLVADRETENAEQRPIIFLCHEYGGILLKRALSYSHSRRDVKLEHLRSIYRSTVSIMFMATPHLGLKKSTVLLYSEQEQHGPSQFTLNMIEGSEALQEVTDQFAPLVKDFRIYNFWETEKTTFGKTAALIVERSSAAPIWDVDQCGIKATHADIVRFKSRASPGYRLVLAALEKYVKMAPREARRKWEQDIRLIQEERDHEALALYSMNHKFPEGTGRILPFAPPPVEPRPLTLEKGTSSNSIESVTTDSITIEAPRSTGTATPPDINVHYLVRRRSEYFVGRQKQTEHLQEQFGAVKSRKSRKPKTFVIFGLPGSGKTQFCLRFIEERRHAYWGVFWIDCTTEETAENSFSLLSQRAGKGTEPGAGQAWLSETFQPWILVLDNANDPDMDLSRFIPISGSGHILITTRNPGAKLHSTVGSFHFTGMDPEEAITLLLRLAYPDKEPHDTVQLYRKHAGSIASELGYLALALKQAAYTIRRRLRPLEEYLASLLGCRKILLSQPMVKGAAEANIVATWELPFTGISNGASTEYRDAVELICIFSFMHFVSIPSSVLSVCSDRFKLLKGLSVRPAALVEPESVRMVEDRVLAAARVLYDYSIISITEVGTDIGGDSNHTHSPRKSFTLHPAIHQWSRERLDPVQQRAWLTCTAAILEQSISTNMEISGRPFRRLLLPHIEACMNSLEREFPNLPESVDQAIQLERFGLVYAEAGRWRKARSLQRKVLDFRMKTLGRRNISTIQAQRHLANTYWNLFEIGDCLKVLQGILFTQWWSRPSLSDWLVWPPWKPQHVSYCATLDELTRSLWLAGMRDLSKRTGTRAVEGLTRSLGSDDPLTLSAKFNLARTYLHLDEPEKSYALLVEVLAKREHFFGQEHPDTLMTRNELGMNLVYRKTRLLEAERLVRSVLESRKRILGEEHAYTMWSVNDLAKVCCELRRFDDAIEMLEEAQLIVRRTLGEEHAGMTMTKANLARAYILSNKWDKASLLVRQVREVVPDGHPDRVHTEWGHAYVLFHREDKVEEAEQSCLTILSWVFENRRLEPTNATVVATIELLKQIYRSQGRDDKLQDLKIKYPQMVAENTGISVNHPAFSVPGELKTEDSKPLTLRARGSSQTF